MLTLQYAKDPVYGDETGNCIILIIKWEEFNEEMPFAATTYDTEQYGVDLYNRAKLEEFGAVAPYITPSVTTQPTTTGSQEL